MGGGVHGLKVFVNLVYPFPQKKTHEHAHIESILSTKNFGNSTNFQPIYEKIDSHLYKTEILSR